MGVDPVFILIRVWAGMGNGLRSGDGLGFLFRFGLYKNKMDPFGY